MPPRGPEADDSGPGGQPFPASQGALDPHRRPELDLETGSEDQFEVGSAGIAQIDHGEAEPAARRHWEGAAHDYQVEHGDFLAGAMVWGPEGLTEAEARLLGDRESLRGARILEIGCGAAQCSAWLAGTWLAGTGLAGTGLAGTWLAGIGSAGDEAEPGPAGAGPTLAGQPEGALVRQEAVRARTGGVLAPPQGLPARPEGLYSPPQGLPARPEGALARPDAHVVAVDLALAQLQHATGGAHVDLIQASATALPFRASGFDVAFSAYGAVQFVADLPKAFDEVRRVLRPGGRWVFSVTHPIRWAFPDDPGPDGLVASGWYFDRTPYVERDSTWHASYAEFHRTLGDYVRMLRRAGFTIEDMVEPEWPDANDRTWGGWSPLRGAHIPGTLILSCVAVA